MTLQTSNLGRAVAGGVVAASLLTVFGMGTAFAQPGDSCTGAECVKTDPAGAEQPSDGPPAMTADEALLIIDRDYDLGAGGGQLSTLIKDVLRLRAQGFKPSNGTKDAIVKALDYRPNQAPLIEALKDTLAYQHRLQALRQNAGNSQQGGYNIGGGGTQPIPPGVPVQPGQNPGMFIGVG
jgi:hypothetical protein